MGQAGPSPHEAVQNSSGVELWLER